MPVVGCQLPVVLRSLRGRRGPAYNQVPGGGSVGRCEWLDKPTTNLPFLHCRLQAESGSLTGDSRIPSGTDGLTCRIGGSPLAAADMTRCGFARSWFELPPSIALVYSVNYLRHRDAVRACLKRREEEAGALRAKIEAERPRISREELLARPRATEKADAPASQ